MMELSLIYNLFLLREAKPDQVYQQEGKIFNHIHICLAYSQLPSLLFCIEFGLSASIP